MSGATPPKGLPELPGVSLSGTAITDAGLEYLVGLKGLERLSLDHTRISDAGIRKLVGMKGLRSLEVSETTISKEAIEELKKALPELNVRVVGESGGQRR